MHLYLFGSPRVEYWGSAVRIGRRKGLALAAYLALEKGAQSRDKAAAVLWPDLDHGRARSALRSTLRALTKPVPGEWIEADRSNLRLNSNTAWVDVRAFSEHLASSSSHAHDPEQVCGDCLPLLEEAADLYRAEFLAGFHVSGAAAFEDWQRAQTEWLRRELSGVLRRLARYHSDAGRFEPALNYARRWLSLDELNESAHRLLMELFARSGQRSEALRQYQSCEEVLDRELASQPEDETRQLLAGIQSNRVRAQAPGGTAAEPASSLLPPLPPLIVGRDEALASMRQRLGLGGDMRQVTVIQGWPGVGKSTVAALIAHDPQIAEQYPDGVLWSSLGEHPDLSGQIASWAGALNLGEQGRARRIEETSAQITAALRDRRVLLIVDDVWRPDHAAPFRVGGQACALVVTSRMNDVAAALAPAARDIYRLPVLSESSGLELLEALTPQAVRDHPQETRELVLDLEGLPLAIHVAGRLLQAEARLGWGVGQLLAELREGVSLLEAKPPSDMIGNKGDMSVSVAALLKRSTDALDRKTRSHFALLGLFVPKPATFDLPAMAAAWEVMDPRPAARALVDRGLLEPVGGGRFQMHALLMLHARSLLASEFGSPV